VAAVNYHFGDKETLYIEAVKAAHACSRMSELPEFPPELSGADKMRWFIRGLAESMTAPLRATAMQLLMREMSNPSAATRAVVTEFIQPVAFRLREIVRELLPEVDDHHLYMIGFSVIGQLLYYRQNRPVSELIFGPEVMAGLTTELVTEHVTRFTLAALGLAEPYPGARPRKPQERRR
jgi:AcrR family transcriptional regulator